MKAERRHELRTNTLSQFLTDLPFYIRFHVNKILIGIIIICIGVLLIRYRMNQAEQAKLAVGTSLTSARQGIDQLLVEDRLGLSDLAKADDRRKITKQVQDSLDTIFQNISESDDPALRAQALIARGDLYWTLATLPPLPGAATQPALAQSQTPVELRQNAEDAYKKALTDYDSQKLAKAAALLALAAIEEDRGDFDKAGSYYKSLLSDSGIAKEFQDVAQHHLDTLSEMKTPVFLGSFSSTQPSSQPSTQAAATMPTSAPATQPQ